MIIDGKLRHLQHRKYCVECSPFGTHNTRKLEKPFNPTLNHKTCAKCKIEKSRKQFYGNTGYCKSCFNLYSVERTKKLKHTFVEYKGGKCLSCGYSKCEDALEFHHTDPTKKEFSISKYRSRSFDKIIKKELDKCVLLCANCHREIEAGMRTL